MTSLFIHNIKKDNDSEDVRILLEKYFSTPKNYGFESSSFLDLDSKLTLELKFLSKEAVNYFLQKKSVSILDQIFMISDCVNDPTQTNYIPKIDNHLDDLKDLESNSKIKEHGTEDTQVLISNIPISMKPELFKIFIQNKKRSGGGDTKDIEIDIQQRTALVTFIDPIDAARLIDNELITYKNEKMSVTKPNQLICSKNVFEKGESHIEKTNNNFHCDGISSTVCIKGNFDESIHEYFILYSENDKYAGGEQKSCIFSDDNKSAIIVFEKAEVAKNFVKHSPHQISNKVFTAELVMNIFEYKSRSITIKLKDKLKLDFMKLMLNNKRFAGKENYLEDIFVVDDYNIVATFLDHESIINVQSSLDNSKYDVKILKPFRPPYLMLDELVDSHSLLFLDLPLVETIDFNKFKKFIETAASATILNFMFLPQQDMLVTKFKTTPDFKRILSIVYSRSFMYKMISIQQMPYSTSIQLLLNNPINHDFLELFFENKERSGAVKKNFIEIDPKCYLIEYENHEDVDQVLKKRLEKINGIEINLVPYYRNIGFLPYNFDTTKPFIYPKDIEYFIENFIFIFLISNISYKNEIDSLLKNECGLITWPTSSKLPLKITFQQSDAKDKYYPQWGDKIKDIMQKFISNFKSIIINREDLYDILINKISDLDIPNNHNLLITHKEGKIAFVGLVQDVNEFNKQISEVIKKIEYEIECSNLLVEKCITTEPGHIKILKLIGSYTEPTFTCEITINNQKNGILIKASQKNIQSAEIFVREKINNIMKVIISCTFVPFLNMPPIIQYFEKLLENKDINAYYSVANDEISLFYLKGESSNIEKFIFNEVETYTQKLEDYPSNLKHLSEWTICDKKLRNALSECIYMFYSKVAFHAYFLKKDKEIAIPILNAFFFEHVTKNESLNLNYGEAMLIERFGRNKLDEIKRNQKINNVDISITISDSKSECCISGNATGFQAVKKELESLRATIIHDEFELPISKTNTFFSKHEITIKGIESKHEVIIIKDSKHFVLKKPEIVRPSKMDEVSPMEKMIDIKLSYGSLVDAKEEAIFYLADHLLNLNKTPLSRELLQKAGDELQKECSIKIEKDKKLCDGQIFESKGYHLNTKIIYHAACPKYNGPESEKILKSLICMCLNSANNKHLKSIAFPALGTGNQKFDANSVVQIMYTEIQNFAKLNLNNLNIEKVNFIIYDKDICEIFKQYHYKFISPQGKNFLEIDNNDDDDDEIMDWSMGEDNEKEDNNDLDDNSNSLGDSNGELNNETIKLCVKKGNIVEEISDIIVNSVNSKFEVNKGELSRQLIKSAGIMVENECKNGRLIDKVAVTSGGNLKCKFLFHLSAHTKDEWQDAIANMLIQASKLQIQSISMPPVGTGRGRLSISELCTLLKIEINKFSKNQKTTLTDVCIVILEDSKFDEFTKFLDPKKTDFISRATNFFKSKFSQKSGGDVKNEIKSHKKNIVNFIHLYSFSKPNLTQALYQLKSLISNLETIEKINSFEMKEIIKRLSENQKRSIVNKFNDKVKVRILNDQIDLSGDSNEVYQIKTQIQEYLLQIFSNDAEAEKYFLLAKTVSWKFKNARGEWVAYGRYSTGRLESGYQKKLKTDEWDNKRLGVRHYINFTDMTDHQDKKNKLEISRKAIGAITLPSLWKMMSNSEIFIAVNVTVNTPEYDKVKTNLLATSGNPNLKIIKIERIQNPALYLQYVNHMNDMKFKNPNLNNVELRLWHGTSQTNVHNINSRNFNRNYAGAHGVAIGNGVYFATNASYSISGYCPPDQQGQRYIYQARVLTGVSGQGQSGLREPPPNPNKPGAYYDSVCNSPAQPSMYVVFYDYQSYPEYLITFM